jgi:hypothetical protein
MACRSEPGPLSFVFVTLNVDAAAAAGMTARQSELGTAAAQASPASVSTDTRRATRRPTALPLLP